MFCHNRDFHENKNYKTMLSYKINPGHANSREPDGGKLQIKISLIQYTIFFNTNFGNFRV
jgi:hypothetical protein